MRATFSEKQTTPLYSQVEDFKSLTVSLEFEKDPEVFIRTKRMCSEGKAEAKHRIFCKQIFLKFPLIRFTQDLLSL